MPLMIPSTLPPDLQRVLRDIDQELYWLRMNTGISSGVFPPAPLVQAAPVVLPSAPIRLDRLTTLIDDSQGWEMIWSDNGTSMGILDFPDAVSMINLDVAKDYYGTTPTYLMRFRQTNLAIGDSAMQGGTGGADNTALGSGTMMKLTVGVGTCTAVGDAALQELTTGLANTAVGAYALSTDGSGSYNTAVGEAAGGQVNSVTGSSRRNTFVGFDAGTYLTSNTQDNIAIGSQCLTGAAPGKSGIKANIGIGVYCCQGLQTNASQMIGIGKRVHAAKSQGRGSIAIGHYSFRYNLTDAGNLSLGNFSGYNNRTPMNMLLGSYSGYGDVAYTSGVGYNYFFGASAGRRIKTAHHNIGIGYSAARNAKRTTYALYLGHEVGIQEMGGSYNFSIGYRSHYKKKGSFAASHGASRPQRLMFLGHYAGYQAHGNDNMFLGLKAGYNASGPRNIVIGPKGGYNLFGYDNLAIGNEVGYDAKTDRSIFVGYRQGYSATGDDLFILGNKQASPLLYGRMAGIPRLGIGQTRPRERLDLMSNASYGAIRVGEHQSVIHYPGTMEFRNADAHFWGYDGNAWVRLDSAGGGGGGASGGVTISVNTHAASGGVVDFRDGLPAVPAGAVNVDWQMAASPSIVSAHVHFGEIVQASLMVRTRYSLTGGGNMMASRTLNLVNDLNAPGANMTYGTNATGVRRWRSFPVGGAAAPNSAKYVVTALSASLGQEVAISGNRGIQVVKVGASLLVRKHLPSRYLQWYNDFGGNAWADDEDWDYITSVGVMRLPTAGPYVGHPGMQEGVTTSAAAYTHWKTSNTFSMKLGGLSGCRWTAETQFMIPILSRAARRFWTVFGFSNRSTGDPRPGAGLEFRQVDHLLGARWQAYASNHTAVANATTSKDTGVNATSNKWVTFRIEVAATPLKAFFYIDDTLRATLTRNIPRANPVAFGWGLLSKVGTAARIVECDYLYACAEWQNRRPA